MWKIFTLFLTLSLFELGDFLETLPLEEIKIPNNLTEILNETRRILRGKDVGDTRPYMVYIRPASVEASGVHDNNWLCGGVIIHERYILTSAACIEQAQHFYVIAGTSKWIPGNHSNDCIKYGAKKAIWKCVPKSYVFDGAEYDNIRWMISDIAVVKVEEDFNFERRIKGCDYVPKMIAYNNQSLELEKPGTLASTAGWGSQSAYSDDVITTDALRALSGAQNSPNLLETEVILISKKNCKKRWPERYHYIIEEHMICGKDGLDGDTMSSVCSVSVKQLLALLVSFCGVISFSYLQRRPIKHQQRRAVRLDRRKGANVNSKQENEVNCKELNYSEEYSDEDEKQGSKKTRRMIVDPKNNDVGATQVGRVKPITDLKDDARRAKANKVISSGFCENDHGGPLVVGHGMTSMVVGVISACQTHNLNRKCFGPFLYTSVYKNRNLIACAIDKDVGATCRKYLKTSEQTAFDWNNHPDGPAKDTAERDVTLSNEDRKDIVDNETQLMQTVHT